MFEINKIYNEDCMQGLNRIPDNSIDAIITDPPYNISRETDFKSLFGGNRRGMDFGSWDKNFDVTSFIYPYTKKLKENANVVIFNSWQNLNEIKNVCQSSNITIKRCLVLSKRNPAPFNRNRMFVNDVEFALWGVYNSKGNPRNWTFNREDLFEKCVIPCNTQGGKYHPTMKDITVIQKLVRLLSNKNEIILDPFMGSGTLALACMKELRNYIGFEINKEYYDKAIIRINEEPLNLF